MTSLVAGVKRLAGEGYRRVKLKIGPGWDLDPIAAVTEAVPEVRLQADANEAYGPDDIDVLVGLDRFGLLCLEQPFPRADLAAHAELAARIRTPICLDEGVDSPAAVERALALGACSAVCVKPSRLGGIGRALEVIDRCSADGVPLWMGGMFESGYARGVNTALAALDGFAWPGDLSPARSYLGADLVPDRPVTGGVEGGIRTALPPTSPGMGHPPDTAALRSLGAKVTVLRPDAL
jgi:O-succinylbenzoate synthase